MKKHELIKHAYDNYPKGTKFKSLTGAIFESTGKFEFDCGSIFRLDENGSLKGNVYTAGWAEIVTDKIAVRVENELEFRALMEFYESKGFKSIIGTPARYFKQGRFNNGGLIKIFSFEDKFICPNDYGEKPETHGLHKFKILSFPEFAKQHELKVPILISEDGVLLYDGDNYFRAARRGSNATGNFKVFDGIELKPHYFVCCYPETDKAFSTREAAEKWIEAQKPKEKNISITPSINAECTKSGVIFSNDGNFLVQVSRDQLSDIAAAIVELNND